MALISTNVVIVRITIMIIVMFPIVINVAMAILTLAIDYITVAPDTTHGQHLANG